MLRSRQRPGKSRAYPTSIESLLLGVRLSWSFRFVSEAKRARLEDRAWSSEFVVPHSLSLSLSLSIDRVR